MTDINDLVGPEPIPVPSPKFPTPWHARFGNVYDANSGRVAEISDCTNEVPNSRDERESVAEFIAQAVNVAVTQRDGNSFYSNAMKTAAEKMKGLQAELEAAKGQLRTANLEVDRQRAEGDRLRDKLDGARKLPGELAPILKQIREAVGADSSESTLSAVERVVAELDSALALVIGFIDRITKIVGDV